MDFGEYALCVGDILIDVINDQIQVLLNDRVGLDFGLELGEQLGINQWCRHFLQLLMCSGCCWRRKLQAKWTRNEWAEKAEFLRSEVFTARNQELDSLLNCTFARLLIYTKNYSIALKYLYSLGVIQQGIGNQVKYKTVWICYQKYLSMVPSTNPVNLDGCVFPSRQLHTIDLSLRESYLKACSGVCLY